MYNTNPPYNNLTFSSSLLNEIFLSIDREPHSAAADTRSSPADGCKLRRLLDQDRKMSTLRRARLVQKWMEKPNYGNVSFTPVDPPPPPPRRRPSPPPPPPPPPPAVVPAAVDEDPDSFFSTTSVSSSDSSFGGLSSTASETETPSFDSSSKPKTSCFGPLRAPKPVKTKAKVSNSEQFEEDCSTNKSSSSSSRAVKIYSQLKSLKQPISPGLKLAKYINSLTSRKKKITKTTTPIESDSFDGPNRKFRGIPVPDRKYKSEQTSPEWSISASSLTKPPYLTSKQDSGVVLKKENESSVSASPTSIAADLKAGSKQALLKRYEELRRLKTGEIGEVEDEVDLNRKVLEEVALDLLNNGYWSRRKEENDDDDDKDDSSCSSSDLFEIDHLSVIGNEELPVYETTRIKS